MASERRPRPGPDSQGPPELGSRVAVDQALSRLVRCHELQRLGRGLYYIPKTNPTLGISVPGDVDDIADAIGRRTGSRVIPSGAVAANRFGLTTQVPAKPVYLTDGRSRRLRVGQIQIDLRHVSPRDLPRGRRTSAMVFQALRHLGKDAVSEQMLARISQALSDAQRQELLEDSHYTTDWIVQAARSIAKEAAPGRPSLVTHHKRSMAHDSPPSSEP